MFWLTLMTPISLQVILEDKDKYNISIKHLPPKVLLVKYYISLSNKKDTIIYLDENLGQVLHK